MAKKFLCYPTQRGSPPPVGYTSYSSQPNCWYLHNAVGSLVFQKESGIPDGIVLSVATGVVPLSTEQPLCHQQNRFYSASQKESGIPIAFSSICPFFSFHHHFTSIIRYLCAVRVVVKLFIIATSLAVAW